jgi:hypothetical protein
MFPGHPPRENRAKAGEPEFHQLEPDVELAQPAPGAPRIRIVKVAGVYESLPADSGSVSVRVSRLLNTALSGLPPAAQPPIQSLQILSERGLYDDASALARVLLETTVAIEVLAASAAGNPQARERFDREGTQWRLNHPHICTLHDVGHAAQRIPTSAIYPGIRTPQL